MQSLSVEKKICDIINRFKESNKRIIIEDVPEDALHNDNLRKYYSFLYDNPDEALRLIVDLICNDLDHSQNCSTVLVNNLCISLLLKGQFREFMILNILNEVAIVADMGPRNQFTKTNWKETVWRKKLINALKVYVDTNSTNSLKRTIENICDTYSDFQFHSTNEKLKQDALATIKLHSELCDYYNLDKSITIASHNPFDFF